MLTKNVYFQKARPYLDPCNFNYISFKEKKLHTLFYDKHRLSQSSISWKTTSTKIVYN